MKDILKHYLIPLAAVTIICLLLFGCMFRELRGEIEEQKISFRLYGRVVDMAQSKGHVYVLLYTQKGEQKENNQEQGYLAMHLFVFPVMVKRIKNIGYFFKYGVHPCSRLRFGR